MHAFTACCVRNQQNTVKTDTKRISRLPHDNTKITKHRSVVVCDTARCSKLVWTLLQDGSGAFGDRPRNPFGRFPLAVGKPGASQDRSGDGPWATRTRHKRMLERFQNGFEHPKLCTIEFLPIFGPFWSLVGSLSCCFFRVFRRFC